MIPHKLFAETIIILLILASFINSQTTKSKLKINDAGYFEARGLNVLMFSNFYDGLFSDAKISGIEIIHHEVRTVTNGDVRLSPTPEQWDPCPVLLERKVDKTNQRIEVKLGYPKFNFNYLLTAEAKDEGILLSVDLENPLPKELENLAGLNLEFLPSAYFEKSFIIDIRSGSFPLYPTGPMEKVNGKYEAKPIAEGNRFIFAPEDPERRISIKGNNCKLSLYDGRNKAQNGWFVLRTLIPANKTGRVVEWYLIANTIPIWSRKPVIAHSQVGYHPSQKKVAVIELDKNDKPLSNARLLKVNEEGMLEEKLLAEAKVWGKYLRYNYLTFDFSSITEEGVYIIEYGNQRSEPFRIASNVYKDAWHATNDIFFPVQMDHMFVNEAYRVWHGASHLDDALQAPVNHEHFDLYKQGPTTDTPYKPGEHIPGLNIGGWFDAGDHDLRTQTHYATILNLVHTWELFHPLRDETTIDQQNRYVDVHILDGEPDILQQIEHGTLQLIAQHRSCGHAIPGIIVSDLSQYTHLGDAVTITDNLLYNSKLKPNESDGYSSSKNDDRWAFTTRTTPLNYGSTAALAAASRALKGFNDKLAEECLSTAIKVWDEEHSHAPVLFSFGNTTGGNLEMEELTAAVELLITTKEERYKSKIMELLPKFENRFGFAAQFFVRAIPFMNEEYKEKLTPLIKTYADNLKMLEKQNPFGVFISTGGWAGNGAIVNMAISNYVLHREYPEMFDKEYVLQGLNYVFGCHPGSDISFVSAVGTKSKKVAYGSNRADFTFIAGGVVPGVLILKPDFPENKEDWPFLWGENEYVINLGAAYMFLVHAANDLLK